MLRGVAKGAALAAFGRVRGGPELYRTLTRRHLGTAASHVDKLQRVWPAHAREWPRLSGLVLEGARIWIHEAGATPFSAFAAFLLTGRAGVLTNTWQPLLDRYVARSVNGALAAGFPEGAVPEERRGRLEPLRWRRDAAGAIRELGGATHIGVEPGRIPLASESIDLCCTGGALEHYRPEALDEFLRESHRILRPGGIASHVFDHRDHLYHADKKLPFLAHLALRDAAYELAFGHPLAYHNRLTPEQVARRFERAGFERIVLRRLTLPAKRFVPDDEVCVNRPGLSRRWLAPRFRDISAADLRTAAAHYLYRKV